MDDSQIMHIVAMVILIPLAFVVLILIVSKGAVLLEKVVEYFDSNQGDPRNNENDASQNIDEDLLSPNLDNETVVVALVGRFSNILFGIAAYRLIVSIFGIWGGDRWGLIDAGLFALCAVGVKYKSRTAAVSALVLYLASIVYSIVVTKVIINFGLLVVFMLPLIQGVRAVFAANVGQSNEANAA